MRLKGSPPGGVPSLSYVSTPSGTIIGSLDLPAERLLAVPGQTGPPGPTNWEAITNRPSEFPPTNHFHTIGSVDGLDEALAAVDVDIDALNVELSGKLPKFMTGTVATASATAAKTVTLDPPWNTVVPAVDDLILLKFTSGTSISSATVAINGGSPIALRSTNGQTSSTHIYAEANASVLFRYDGTYLRPIGMMQNTTYSTITEAEIDAGTSTSSRVISAQRVAYILSKSAPASHTHAIADVTDLQASLDAKEPTLAAGTTAQYYRGDKTWQTLNKAAVGLSSVDNTADSAKNVLSATKLTTARTINGVSFDGTANITVADSTKQPTIPTGTTSQYYRGDKTWQTLNQDAVPDGTTNKAYTATEKTKLAGIATGATANSSDATLLNRANHTGSQAISTVSGLQTALDSKAPTSHTHTDKVGTDGTVLDIKKVTQAQYDALGAGRPATTLYVIVG